MGNTRPQQFSSLDELEIACGGLRKATDDAIRSGLQSLPGVLDLPLDPPADPEADPEGGGDDEN